MQLNPYLVFNGQCEEAFKYYEKLLGGRIVMMLSHGESPMRDQTPVERHHHILHARLTIGEQFLMGSDAPPDCHHETKGMAVSLMVDTPAEAERIYHALAENAQIQMPLQPTFWAQRFGMLTDRFGTPWMINCEQAAQKVA